VADYTKSKEREQLAYPVEAKEVSGLMTRVESMLTPELLKSRYLHGLDVEDYTDDELKQEIMIAMNEIEALTGLNLTKIQFKERIPYDHSLYRNFLHVKTNHGPILSVDKFAVESSNGQDIYELPADWIEMGFAHKRQINLLPILTVFGTSGTIASASPSGALIFLQSLSNYRWLPAFWSITYTAGVCKEDGKLPVVINDLIGLTAGIEVLSAKQNLIRYTSQSLGQDGISQSSSGPGPQTYQARIELLQAKRDRLLKRVKAIYSNKYFLSNI
jgi:hypothetical protein